jgi:hypothetical protein
MKITLDFSRNQVSIDGDGPELLNILEKARELMPQLSEINIVTSRASNVDGALGNPPKGPNDGASGHIPAPREFAKKIAPATAAERIATIATYQKRYQNRDFFSPKEMEDWFSHFGFSKPTQMTVAVFDAKKGMGYVENVGYAKWRLTPTGENFVVRKES